MSSDAPPRVSCASIRLGSAAAPARRGFAARGCGRQAIALGASPSAATLATADRASGRAGVSGVRVRLAGQHGLDRRAGPSSALVSRATSAATSLMRSRSSAFSTRSDAQDASASRFIVAISRCSLVALFLRVLELLLERRAFPSFRLSIAERWRPRARRARRAGRLRSCARSSSSLRSVLESYSRSVRQPALLVEAGHQFLHAPAENFGFRGLRDELAFELGDAIGQASDFCVRRQLLARRVASAASTRSGARAVSASSLS